MTPEPFTGCNVLVRPPNNWDVSTMGPCMALPAYVGRGLIVTAWRPDPAELALLVGGGVIIMTVMASAPNPTMLAVVRTGATLERMAEG